MIIRLPEFSFCSPISNPVACRLGRPRGAPSDHRIAHCQISITKLLHLNLALGRFVEKCFQQWDEVHNYGYGVKLFAKTDIYISRGGIQIEKI
jgi:hypothetical protein